MQVVRAEDLPQPFDFRLDAASRSPDSLEQGTQLAAGEFGRRGRGGCGSEHNASACGVESWLAGAVESHQGSRVVLAQVRAEPVDHLLSIPDRVLMGTGQDRDSLAGFAVLGQRPVSMLVGPEDVGQHSGVGGVGFGPRDAAAIAVSSGSQRVDRVDLPAGGSQAGDQQTTRGLDGDRNRVLGGVSVAG